MRRLLLIALPGCTMLITACASRPPTSWVAPRLETPAEAARPCSLYILPPAPTESDIEIGYATRGAQLVACDAARRLAVQTLEAEHALQDQLKLAR